MKGGGGEHLLKKVLKKCLKLKLWLIQRRLTSAIASKMEGGALGHVPSLSFVHSPILQIFLFNFFLKLQIAIINIVSFKKLAVIGIISTLPWKENKTKISFLFLYLGFVSFNSFGQLQHCGNSSSSRQYANGTFLIFFDWH